MGETKLRRRQMESLMASSRGIQGSHGPEKLFFFDSDRYWQVVMIMLG